MQLRQSVRFVVLAMALLIGLMVLAGCSSPASTPTADQSSSSAGSATTGSTSAEPPATSSTAGSASSESAVNSQGEKMYTPTYKLNGKETAVIKTSKGTIKVKFYENDAPIAIANFIELALKGYYDGQKFHRFVANFVIQGGDPQTKAASSADVAAGNGQFGTGGPGYAIKDEYANNPNKHVDGSLAMARTGAPDSGGSQFYFALGPLPSLDGQYTVFGQATEGLDVIHELRAGDEIKSVTIENASK
jgi:peptidyl-prolyl cis-trans isomerase B (cyclophilin B)